jgi:hypothetical protein
MIKICKKCGKEKEHHAKGLCYACYRNIAWDPPIGQCKRCRRKMLIHAKGLCKGCYNFVFKLESTKAWNYKKQYGLNLETYKKITKACDICGFDKIVDLHHLNENKNNNSEENLIGLCPNHHKMLHDFRYRKEIRNKLIEKGFKIPEDIKLDFSLND